jgi:hypothetical protein
MEYHTYDSRLNVSSLIRSDGLSRVLTTQMRMRCQLTREWGMSAHLTWGRQNKSYYIAANTVVIRLVAFTSSDSQDYGVK